MASILRRIESFMPASVRLTSATRSRPVISEIPNSNPLTVPASNDTPSRPRYHHVPLKTRDNFRLLRFCQARGDGVHDSPLEGTLIEYSLEDNTEYECLSYTWGAQTLSHNIFLGGRPLPITANLDLALRNSQRAAETKLLWVDAICINQDDLEERSQQVQQMRTIFSRAKHVIAYLGEEMDGSQHIPDICRTILEGAIRWRQTNPLSHAPSKNFMFPEHFRAMGLPSYGDQAWTIFMGFLARPWFLRVWIVQEAVCARKLTFVCGSWTITREVLWTTVEVGTIHALPLCRISEPKFTEASSSRAHIMLMVELQSGGLVSDPRSPRPSLLDLARRSKHQKATDPRDNIYALLGLSNEHSTPGLQPDYTELATNTYRRFATHFVNTGDGARLLIEAAHSSGSDPELPSWVPDWSIHDDNIHYIPPPDNLDPDYLGNLGALPQPGGGLSTKMNVEPCGNRLSLQVYLIDTIERIGSAHLRYSHLVQGETSMAGLLAFCQELAGCIEEIGQMLNAGEAYPTGEPKAEVFCKTVLCNGRLGMRLGPDDYDHLRGPFRFLLVLTSLFRPSIRDEVRRLPESLFPLHDSFNEIMLFVTAAQQPCASMRRCLTRKAYIGQVPPTAQIGDTVCFVAGAPVPFLLRPRGGSEFSLLGQCYLHGFMKEEVLSMPEYRAQEITII
ncbi:hypothetical protein GP486_000922 [Trichoglossum hirsutum]|uniref:Heterokaryon incompatibility domain-containing protein n=1 Tax=Trichoglossum hirsutum TaxID=265104 RepID=A0A9P8RTI5_9PEZI|nr:hypothetical protein GP486_000922 [Trichoglossum hirsutum]